MKDTFTSATAFYKALVTTLQEHASTLPLSPRCLLAPLPLPEQYDDRSQFDRAHDRWHGFIYTDSKIDGPENSMDYTIAGDIIEELHSKWVKNMGLDEDSYGYSLHHPDFSVNNIFIDDDCNITCIIDWGFCSAVPLSMAITVPGLPQSRYEVSEELTREFMAGFQYAAYDVSLKVSPAERHTFCRIFQHSRPMWLLARILNFDSISDYPFLNDVWTALNPNVGTLLAVFKGRQSSPRYVRLYEALKMELIEDASDDVEEARYLEHLSKVDLTVAKKLMLNSQWSCRYQQSASHDIRKNMPAVFIADTRLWKWIDRCILDLDEIYPYIGNKST